MLKRRSALSVRDRSVFVDPNAKKIPPTASHVGSTLSQEDLMTKMKTKKMVTIPPYLSTAASKWLAKILEMRSVHCN